MMVWLLTRVDRIQTPHPPTNQHQKIHKQADNARLREERRAAVTATAELRARNARVERELEGLKKREAVASRARAALLAQVCLGSGWYHGGWMCWGGWC